MSRLPLPSATLILICTALCTQFSTLVPVLDLLAKQASILAGLHRLSCTLYLAAPDLLPRSLSAPASPRREPVSSNLSPVRSSPFHWPPHQFKMPLLTPVGSLFWFTSFLRHFSKTHPPPPPPASTTVPVPSVPKGVHASSPGLLPSSAVLPLRPLPYLPFHWYLLGVVVYV